MPTGDLLAILAGALGGGASTYGQALDVRQQKQRQAGLDAVDIAAKRQAMQQGQESHDLAVLGATNPLARIQRGTAPTPQGPVLGTSAPFQPTSPGALAAIGSAAEKAGGLARFAQPRPIVASGDDPNRYVQAGAFYADTGRLDPKTERDLAFNRSAYETLKAKFGDQMPDYTPGLDYAKEFPHLLESSDRRASLNETTGYHTAELGLRGRELAMSGARLGVEQGNLGVNRDRLRFDQQFGKPMERETGLANDYNHMKPVEDADKFATNAAMTLRGVQLARQGNPNGQLMAITGFLRQTHPDAVVRTNDKGMLVEAQGVPAETQAMFNRLVGRGGILTQAALEQIEQATTQMAGMQRAGLAPIQANFGQRAHVVGADSARVVRDPFAALPGHDAPAPARPSLPERAAQLKAAGKSLDETRAIMQREGY